MQAREKNAQPHAMRGGHRKIFSDELCKADGGQAPRLPPPPTPPRAQVMNTQHGQKKKTMLNCQAVFIFTLTYLDKFLKVLSHFINNH